MYIRFIGDQFFSPYYWFLCIPAYLGIKGDRCFSDLRFFWRSFYVQIGVLQYVSRVQFYAKLSDFYAKLNVLNLYVTNLYFSFSTNWSNTIWIYSKCFKSICTKTYTNLLHTNSIHSISHKNWMILHKIGQVIQIVVHQFVCKTSTKKNWSLKKIGPPLSPGMQEYVESVLRRKKLSPYHCYVRGKHVN